MLYFLFLCCLLKIKIPNKQIELYWPSWGQGFSLLRCAVGRIAGHFVRSGSWFNKIKYK